MSVHKATLPPKSALWLIFQPEDYMDCYACASALAPEQAAHELAKMPKWVAGLMKLRNAAVRPFGLRTKATSAPSIGIFPILIQSKDEMVLGHDDRHLDFKISVLRDRGEIHLATLVKPHNLAGRAYLAAIMPFHKLIVKTAVRRMGRV
ncbi:MAG: hypothetical protein ACJA2X_000170 [Halocynthiibacter sp.]|jgi:hypothetical protein